MEKNRYSEKNLSDNNSNYPSRKLQWRHPEGDIVSAIFAGDFSPREENSDDVAARAGEITEEIKPLFEQCDLRFLQLECAVTRKDTPIPKSGPNHRSHEGCLNLPAALDINAVLLANNHTGDYGNEGLQDTLKFCHDAGFQTVGAGNNAAEAAAPLILTCRNLKIALLNQAEHEFGIAGKNSPGCAGLDPIALAEQITVCKEQCDLVYVALHGGHEHFPFPSPRLRKLCRFLADNGADLVFNCHSHCPCGYEIYQQTPIIYSPGNFYFPPRPTSLPCWFIGYLPKFHCDKQGVFALEIIPYYNHQDKIKLLNERETAEFFQYLDTLNRPISNTDKLEALFDSWCSVFGAKGYLPTLFNLEKPENWTPCAKDQNWLGVRNIFCCESHNDLLRNTMTLMEQCRISEAEEQFAEISALQRPQWIRKK